MGKVRNILFVERKLSPTGGGVQRVSYILGESFMQKGYGVWYAFEDIETDTSLIPEDRKLKYCSDISEELLMDCFSQFIEDKNIDTLLCQNVYAPKFCRIYGKLKDRYELNVIACLHANPDKSKNKNSWHLTMPSIYIADILRSIRNWVFGDRYLEEMRSVYKVSDRYVLLSERFKPVFKEILKINSAAKLCAISNPCSLVPSQPVRKENILLVVGRMEEGQKRISNILRVWKSIATDNLDWQLIVVGGGPHIEKYKRMSNRLKLPRISFVGPSNRVEEYYSRSKIFLMTSIWEGFAMTLIEAQNAGCVPVVFDNFAAVHDIIDGSNGIVVKSNDLAAYISAVSSLIDDQDMWQTMSKNARLSVNRRFQVDGIVAQWETLFNEFDS